MREDDIARGEIPEKRDYLTFLRETKYKYIFIVLAGSAFFLPMLFFNPCLGLIIFPLALVFFIWLLRIDNIWHQLVIGVIAFCVGALFAGATSTYLIMDISEVELQSDDEGPMLIDGAVFPIRGGEDTVFNYTITVVTDANTSDIDAHLLIMEDLHSLNPIYRDETMTDYFQNTIGTGNNTTVISVTYYHETMVNGAVNGFAFNVGIGGSSYNAPGIEDNVQRYMHSPVITSEELSIWGMYSLSWLIQIFANGFFGFLIILLFLRLTRKSAEARKKMMEQYQMIKKEKESGYQDRRATRAGSKKLPGISAGGERADDVFVCSECGADVPATAKFCPNCGEPFDEEE